MIKVMQEIRDAFDHLYHILDHTPPYSPIAQANINSELEKYKGHLQRLAVETVRQVADHYIALIESHFTQKGKVSEWRGVSHQIALQVKKGRDRAATNDFHARYQVWVE